MTSDVAAQEDELAAETLKLFVELEGEYPHLRTGVRAARKEDSKLGLLENKLVDRFRAGLAKLWSVDE